MKVSTDAADRVRIDKWLWAARFFKTRSQATDAVERGRVQINDQPVRPAKDVKIGDRVRVHAHEQQWELEVLALAEIRGPASVAQTLYAETDTSRLKRDQPSGTGVASTNWVIEAAEVSRCARVCANLRGSGRATTAASASVCRCSA